MHMVNMLLNKWPKWSKTITHIDPLNKNKRKLAAIGAGKC